jgi:hypothetical protein
MSQEESAMAILDEALRKLAVRQAPPEPLESIRARAAHRRRRRHTRRFAAGVLIVAVTLVAVAALSANDDDGDRNVRVIGQPTTTTNSPTPKELWQVADAPNGLGLSSIPYPAPVVVDDLVIVPGGYDDIGRVDAYDDRTGARRWRYETGSSAFLGPVAQGLVIVMPQHGFVAALDQNSGTERWRLALEPAETPFAATVVEGVLYLGTSFLNEGDVGAPPRVHAIDV